MGQTLVKILEEAKQVEDLPNIYVTPEGRVFKVQELAYSDNGNGYITFKHMVNGKQYTRYVHREVAKLFCENRDDSKTVDHIDGNKSNNHYKNLRWFTLAQNVRAYFKKDYAILSPRGVPYYFSNIREFAEKNELDSSSLTKVLKGKLRHTKGWRALPKDE